jgi:hypothetical protein
VARKKTSGSLGADLIRIEEEPTDIVRQPRFRKHVAVVHSYAPITLVQRKLLNVLLYRAVMASEFGDEGAGAVGTEGMLRKSGGAWFQISLWEIRKMLGIRSRNVEWLVESLQALQTAVIEYNLLGDREPNVVDDGDVRKNEKPITITEKKEKGKSGGIRSGSRTIWESCVLIPAISLSDDGTLRYQINEVVKSYLLRPEIYASLDMREQARLKTKSGHALYELVCRFQNVGSSGFLDLDQWRKLLGVPGLYPRWGGLRKQVIEPAIMDVNTHTQFMVRAELRKKGRAITRMRMVFERKAGNPNTSAETNRQATQRQLIHDLVLAGVHETQAERLVHAYAKAMIEQALGEVRALLEKGTLTNPGGWVVRRIQNLAASHQAHMDLSSPVEEAINQEAVAPSIESLSEAQRQGLWKAFVSTLTPVETHWLGQFGPEHEPLRAMFVEFVEEFFERQARRRRLESNPRG